MGAEGKRGGGEEARVGSSRQPRKRFSFSRCRVGAKREKEAGSARNLPSSVDTARTAKGGT